MNLTINEINLVIQEAKRLNEIHAQEIKNLQAAHQKELDDLSLKYNRQLRDLIEIHHIVEGKCDRFMAQHVAYLNSCNRQSFAQRILNVFEVIWTMFYLAICKVFHIVSV